MTIRDAMRATAAQFVVPGENIQEVIAAQTGSPWVRALGGGFGLLGVLITASFNNFRIVAVTDQRILVLDSGKMGWKRARGVLDVLPRETVLGNSTGLAITGLWHVIEVPSGKIRVHRRFFKDIEAADRGMTGVPSN